MTKFSRIAPSGRHPRELRAQLLAGLVPSIRRFEGSPCLEWSGPRNSRGYGRLYIYSTHRLAWTLLRGDIPDGLEIDHRCFNPPCANVLHLEPVTQAVNLDRKRIKHENDSRSCVNGHPYPNGVPLRYFSRPFCTTCLEQHLIPGVVTYCANGHPRPYAVTACSQCRRSRIRTKLGLDMPKAA